MGISSVSVTAGVGTSIQVFNNAAGFQEQYVRQTRATGSTLNEWTITVAGSANVVAADVTRVGMLMVNGGTGRVWVRFDGTIPTTTAHGYVLYAGDRYDVPDWAVQLAVSFMGEFAGGEVYTTLGTAV